MPSVFDVLGTDHQEVKRMLSELEKGPTAMTGASDNYLMLRKKVVEQLIIEESRHEALEEMYFWPVVRDRLPDGDHLADTATGQEQEGKQVLAQLDKLNADQPESGSWWSRSSTRAGSTSLMRRSRSGRCSAERSPRRRPSASATRSLRARRPPRPARIRTRRRQRGCSRAPGLW
jgi:hypothetical protein